MPGEYDESNRIIRIHTDLNTETELTIATIVHFAVRDWLQGSGFGLAHLPEVIELAAVLVGLGMPRNRVSLVKQASSFWDSTVWDAFPRPFLDTQCHAYANAIASWIRNDKTPAWAHEMEIGLKKPMLKSIKFLFKSNDSFFQLDRENLVEPNQAYWLEMADSRFVSSQIVALKFFEPDESISAEQKEKIVSFLRSNNRFLILHAISTTETFLEREADQPIIDELKLLLEDSDAEIHAKAMMALTKSIALDQQCIEFAIKMMESSTRYVRFAATMALASLGEIDEVAINTVNRAFCRSLQSCDYDFVEMFAMAYTKWFDNPKEYLKSVLVGSYDEYVDIANEAIDNAKQQFVKLGE